MPYNVQVIPGTTERLQHFEGRKILSPRYFFIGEGAIAPPLPRIDASAGIWKMHSSSKATVHFAVSHFAVFHYLTITLTLTLSLTLTINPNPNPNPNHTARKRETANGTSRSSHTMRICVCVCSGACGRTAYFGTCEHSAEPDVYVISSDRQYGHHVDSHCIHVRRQPPVTSTGQSPSHQYPLNVASLTWCILPM